MADGNITVTVTATVAVNARAAQRLREAVNEVMHYQFTHSRAGMHALQALIDAANNAAEVLAAWHCAATAASEEAADEIARLRDPGSLHRAWVTQALHLALAYRDAEPGREVRDAMRAMKEHLEGRQASLPMVTDAIARLQQQVADRDMLRDALAALVAAESATPDAVGK